MSDDSPTSPTSPAGSHAKRPKDLKKRLKASYDAIAPKYNEWTTTSDHNKTRLKYLDQLIAKLAESHKTNRSKSILELGCGAGLPVTATLLSHPNVHITANDLSTTQITLAKQNLPNGNTASGSHVTFIESDMMSLYLPVQAFDAVVAVYSIIHLPKEEQVTLIKRIAKWLKPGGWFFANFGAEIIEGNEDERWLGEEKGWMFWSGWGEERTLEVLREAEFEVEVKEVVVDIDDGARFLWVLARKPVSKEEEDEDRI
ncbi:S-adenosyl-L-methionine-dependent methyltransferase [Tothia fuscella]|uniref:S-adenosyl-L-methionine-dependent methyltransferase n=1 Tax=Tothia fuscella TaxID=1048955 RepID=A0A9P4NES4_9PEZI|nr:S-adenosyl-L-methionine-dependent methyltransferase [Tothia fuscella]